MPSGGFRGQRSATPAMRPTPAAGVASRPITGQQPAAAQRVPMGAATQPARIGAMQHAAAAAAQPRPSYKYTSTVRNAQAVPGSQPQMTPVSTSFAQLSI